MLASHSKPQALSLPPHKAFLGAKCFIHLTIQSVCFQGKIWKMLLGCSLRTLRIGGFLERTGLHQGSLRPESIGETPKRFEGGLLEHRKGSADENGGTKFPQVEMILQHLKTEKHQQNIKTVCWCGQIVWRGNGFQ